MKKLKLVQTGKQGILKPPALQRRGAHQSYFSGDDMTPNRNPKPPKQFLLLFSLKPGGSNITHVHCLKGGKIEYSR